MNSRERIKYAINHKEADRVPIDNNGGVSGMHEVAYKNLLNYLSMQDEIRIYDPIQRLAEVKDEVKDLLGVDVRYILPNDPSFYKFKIEDNDTFTDEIGAVYKKVGYYYENCFSPFKGKTLDEIKSHQLPDPKDKARFEGLREKASNLHCNTSYSLWAGSINTIFYFAWRLRGMEEFMMDLYADKKIARYIMDMIVDWNMSFFEDYYDKIGDYIDVFWMADDWGTQSGSLIAPDYFRKEVVPRFKKMISFIKTKTAAKCVYHSCGSTRWCIGDLIEMGVDIVQPLQPNAEGNETKGIKRDFGDKIVIHGGTNNQGLFHKDIYALTIDTLNRIKDLAPGGGYIFSSGHNIQANMPPENIIRLFELAREYGVYPIDIDKINNRIKEEQKLLTMSV